MTAPRAVTGSPSHSVLAARDASPVYFGRSGRTLFGWYHRVHDPRCAVVICSPLGNESTGWHRASRHWAERLAAAGVAALRFDYDGAGDSLGDMTDPNRVLAWTDSVSDAAVFLRAESHADNVVAAGVRIGATLALAVAREQKLVQGLILWAPFANGRAFLREGRAFTRLMAPSEAIEAVSDPNVEQFGGLALTRETVAELESFDPLAGEPRLELPMLVVPREDGSTESAIFQRLAQAGARVTQKEVTGYAAVITDAHQSEVPDQMIRESIDWIRKEFHADDEDRTSSVARASDAVRKQRDRDDDTNGNGVSERAIRIGEHRLFGILSTPRRGTSRATGVILVNSGSVYRVGPNRLHVTLARGWAELGYTVLRMDLGGLGDSPSREHGDENRPYPDHAVKDVAAGIAALRDEGVRRIVVGGLCSGAHTAFHAALNLDGIDGVMLVNPIVFYWKPSDPLDVGAWRTYVESRHYRQSALKWSSWRKLLSGHVSLTYVGSIAYRRAAEIMRAKWTATRRRLDAKGEVTESAPRDLGRIASRGTDVLLLFSEGDPGHDYLTLNYGRELARLARIPGFHLRVVSDADHTFTMLDARHRASAVMTEHLVSHHP